MILFFIFVYHQLSLYTVIYYYSPPLQMQITLDYSLCSLSHIPNAGQSQLREKSGIIPLQSLCVLLNSWTLLTGTLCYLMMISILTGQPEKTTSCRSWKSVFPTVWSRLRGIYPIGLIKSVVKVTRKRNALFHIAKWTGKSMDHAKPSSTKLWKFSGAVSRLSSTNV